MSLTELTLHLNAKTNERFVVPYLHTIKMWAVTFTPQGEMEPRTLMNGSLIIKDNWFFDRIQTVMDGIERNAIETIDSGTLEFRHPEGDLALSGQLEANRGEQKSIFLLMGGKVLIVLI